MSEAWLTRTQSRGELDTSSSISLARSIYGSQAYFDGSNSYQGSEVNLFRTTSQVSNATSTRHLNRPKSSPARAIAERNQKLRPSSAMPASYGGHQFTKSRPGSAILTHGRPKSALQRAGRPTSALQHQIKRRPQTASPWATPLIEVEDYDELAETQSTSRIRSTNPVTLNSIPEYIKVWEGKPLLPRDYGMKHFDRKPWQRPKSDYGLRSGWRRRRKSGQDGMTPVVSVTEVDEGLHDNGDDDQKTKLAWGQDDDHGWGDRSGNKSLFDDGRGGLDDGHGKHDKLDRTGKYGDGSGSSSNLRDTHDDSDLWASRIQPPKEDSDSDDDFFKKSEGSSGELTQLPSVTNLTNEKPESISRSGIDSIESPTEPTIKLPPVTAVSKAPPPPATPWPVAKGDTGRSVLIQMQQQKPMDSQWMNYRMALARHSTRFELPMDMKRLESMSPEQYLCTHCIVSDRRVQHYKRIFTAAKKKSHPLKGPLDCLHGYEELVAAIIDAHYESLSEEEVHKVIDIVCLLPDQAVDFKLFCGVCALTERMYRDKFISSRSSGAVQEYGRYKEIVEDADFEALDWKLRGCKISKSLRKLFSQL